MEVKMENDITDESEHFEIKTEAESSDLKIEDDSNDITVHPPHDNKLMPGSH